MVGPVVPVSPKHERLKAEIAAMADRGLTVAQMATLAKIPRDRVEDLLDEIDLTPEPARRSNPLEAHYRWWASLSRAKAAWLADRGLRQVSWQASVDAHSFDDRANRAAS